MDNIPEHTFKKLSKEQFARNLLFHISNVAFWMLYRNTYLITWSTGFKDLLSFSQDRKDLVRSEEILSNSGSCA